MNYQLTNGHTEVPFTVDLYDERAVVHFTAGDAPLDATLTPCNQHRSGDTWSFVVPGRPLRFELALVDRDVPALTAQLDQLRARNAWLERSWWRKLMRRAPKR